MKIRVKDFQVLHFKAPDPVTKEAQEVILIYALGDDGVMYEFNGTWIALPIETEALRERVAANRQ